MLPMSSWLNWYYNEFDQTTRSGAFERGHNVVVEQETSPYKYFPHFRAQSTSRPRSLKRLAVQVHSSPSIVSVYVQQLQLFIRYSRTTPISLCVPGIASACRSTTSRSRRNGGWWTERRSPLTHWFSFASGLSFSFANMRTDGVLINRSRQNHFIRRGWPPLLHYNHFCSDADTHWGTIDTRRRWSAESQWNGLAWFKVIYSADPDSGWIAQSKSKEPQIGNGINTIH